MRLADDYGFLIASGALAFEFSDARGCLASIGVATRGLECSRELI